MIRNAKFSESRIAGRVYAVPPFTDKTPSWSVQDAAGRVVCVCSDENNGEYDAREIARALTMTHELSGPLCRECNKELGPAGLFFVERQLSSKDTNKLVAWDYGFFCEACVPKKE